MKSNDTIPYCVTIGFVTLINPKSQDTMRKILYQMRSGSYELFARPSSLNDLIKNSDWMIDWDRSPDIIDKKKEIEGYLVMEEL